jgi:hypothetical protein
MTVIGELIKKAISLSGWVSTDEHPAKAQKEVLKKLLEQAKHTAFGKHYHFEDVLNADALEQAFQAQVPIHDYDKIHADWWHYLAKGHQNITWPGTQQYFALSSGTTSHSKQIPVTDDLLEAIRKAGIQQVLSLRNFDHLSPSHHDPPQVPRHSAGLPGVRGRCKRPRLPLGVLPCHPQVRARPPVLDQGHHRRVRQDLGPPWTHHLRLPQPLL